MFRLLRLIVHMFFTCRSMVPHLRAHSDLQINKTVYFYTVINNNNNNKQLRSLQVVVIGNNRYSFSSG